MSILESVPTVQAEDPQALIEEAERHRRHRRWFTACVVALMVAVSLGVYAGISWSSGGGPSKGTPTAAARSLVGLPANNSAYRECPGSARVGPATSPDGLPAMTSRTNDLAFVVFVARTWSVALTWDSRTGSRSCRSAAPSRTSGWVPGVGTSGREELLVRSRLSMSRTTESMSI